MRKLLGALSVFLVIFVIVVYARDCRVSFSQWRYCGENKQEPGIVGDLVNFDWNFGGLFSDVLYVNGKPAARLVFSSNYAIARMSLQSGWNASPALPGWGWKNSSNADPESCPAARYSESLSRGRWPVT